MAMMGEEPNLRAALTQARRPVDPPRMPPADLRTRLTTSRPVRRLLPTALMVRWTEARVRRLWAESPELRTRARAAVEAIVAGTARAEDVEELTLQHAIESEVATTLMWQPWAVPAMDEVSQERLHEALASGRGVLVSTCHLGPHRHCQSVFAPSGATPYSVVGPWLFQTGASGYWGRRLARRLAEAAARGERLVSTGESFAVVERLLAEREVVVMFFSMPGTRETGFLGKRVMLSSGSSRLAVRADALVLPLRTRRVAHHVHVDVCAPLDPRDFADAEQLHDALARVHECLILEAPAAMEDPNREGAWEGGADAQAWIRGAPRRAAREVSA
jgi:hypothetical protein